MENKPPLPQTSPLNSFRSPVYKLEENKAIDTKKSPLAI